MLLLLLLCLLLSVLLQSLIYAVCRGTSLAMVIVFWNQNQLLTMKECYTPCVVVCILLNTINELSIN